MSVWDDPEIRIKSDYAAFSDIGDTVSGTVMEINVIFDEMYNKKVPKIMLNTSEGEVILTGGQVRLMAELSLQRPEVGDHLTVTLTEVEKRAGGKTLKHFDVIVVKGKGAPAAEAPAGMTPEQLAAVELLKASGLSA